jgi:hypothetical protein
MGIKIPGSVQYQDKNNTLWNWMQLYVNKNEGQKLTLT